MDKSLIDIVPLINSIILTIVAAALTFLATMFWTRRQHVESIAATLRDATTERDRRITDLERQIGVISAAVVPISVAFQAVLVNKLTHMHTPELDALMQKIGPPSTLTADEQKRMSDLLAERSTDMGDLITDAERHAAVMLPLVIEWVALEADKDPGVISEETLKLVRVPPLEKEPR